MAPTRQQIELAAKVAPAVMPIARTIASEKMNERAMRKRKEAELEVIEAKQEHGSGGAGLAPATDAAPDDAVEEQPPDAFSESVDRMIADEDCDLCSRLLEGIKSVDPGDRAVALSEYGRFKQSADDTEDVSEIRDEIQGMTVLKDVMEDQFRMTPGE